LKGKVFMLRGGMAVLGPADKFALLVGIGNEIGFLIQVRNNLPAGLSSNYVPEINLDEESPRHSVV
jgi:hypothetical protein